MFFKKRMIAAPGQSATWMLTLGLLATIGLLLALSLQVQYKRTLAETEDRLMAEARTVDENVGVNLTVANLLLTNIIKMLKNSHHPGGEEMNAYLRQQEKLIPGIRTFLVTDERGRVILSNRQAIIGYDGSKRDYFKSALTAGNDHLIITPPFKSILGSNVVSIARVVTGAHGEFRGVVTASLDREYFLALLRAVLYSTDNHVSLVHSSGVVFISVPDPNKIEGKKLVQKGALFLKHKEGGRGLPSSAALRLRPGKTGSWRS